MSSVERASQEEDRESDFRLELLLLNSNRYPEAKVSVHEEWVRALLTELAPAVRSFALRFVGDRAMRSLNRQFRGIDRPTDVLSFPGDDGPEGYHLGDVAVSIPAARRQAAERREPVEHEIRTLILHGVLHCLGYDHEADDGEMARLERQLRARWLEVDR